METTNHQAADINGDSSIDPITIETLVRLKDFINLAELARRAQLPEQTLFAKVRRAKAKIDAGKKPKVLEPELGLRIHEALLREGINIIQLP